MTANFNGLEGTSGFDLAPAGSGSKVTWTFGYATGSSPLKRWKALMLDGFVGAEYSNGLAEAEGAGRGRSPSDRTAGRRAAASAAATGRAGRGRDGGARAAAPAEGAAPAASPPPPQRR